MASSSITFRRRNVTFTNRPPQIVRYSYHGGGGGADASTSISTFSNNPSSGISKYPPMISSAMNEPTYQNMNDTSSSISSSPPPIYDNVPAMRHSPAPNINNNNIPKNFAPIPPRKLPYMDGRRMSLGHRWANNDGIERIDVIQKNSGVTHVNIGDKSYYNNVMEDDDEDEEMAMHLYECIEQFNTACDKILGARQLIDTDTSLTANDREKLLKLVNKSILQGKGRLDTFDQGATISSSSNRTTTLSGGTGSNASMGAPSHLASPSPTPSEPNKISIDANFINRYGPQIMHLLQENMSKQN